MTKTGKIIIWSLVGFFLLIIVFFIVQLKKLADASFEYAGFKITNVTLQKITIRVFMKITNNGLLSVQVVNQKYQAFLNKNLVSSITNLEPFLIKPGVSYMPLEVEVKLSDAVKAGAENLLALIGDKSKANVSIIGTYELKLGAFSIRDLPFEEKFNLAESNK